MSLSKLRSRLGEGLVEFVWRQWGQMGISSHVGHIDRWSQDPEALLLVALELGRREPRLFDEVLDWVLRTKARLSVQRLRNIAKLDRGFSQKLLDATFCCLHRIDRRISWANEPATDSGPPAPLFFNPDGSPAWPVGSCDPAFLEFGLTRSIFVASGKSGEPELSRPINLAFRLREIFGVSSRAEVVRCLLLRPEQELTTAEIAGASGYAKRNVQETLTGLASGGVIRRTRSTKEDRWAMESTRWLSWLSMPDRSLPWVHWPVLFRRILELWRWLNCHDWEPVSAYLQASQARRMMTAIAPALETTGLAWWATNERPHHGVDYLPVFEADVDRLLGLLK